MEKGEFSVNFENLNLEYNMPLKFQRLNDWKNSTRCKFRRSQNGEKGISITALEKKALALFGTAPYTTTVQTVKAETKPQNQSSPTTTESEHNAEVESMLQEVAFAEVDQDNHIIVRKRSISAENQVLLTKSIKMEKRQPTINKKTIIFDFDASDENIDEEAAAQFIVEGMEAQKTSRHSEEESLRNEQNVNISPKKISLAQNLQHATSTSDSTFHSSIAFQLKRIADVKEEKLKFEIAKYKHNNPGFKYDYNGTEGSQDEPQDDVLVSVFNEAHY